MPGPVLHAGGRSHHGPLWNGIRPSQHSYAEVLIHRTSACDLIWEFGDCRVEDEFIREKGGPLMS